MTYQYYWQQLEAVRLYATQWTCSDNNDRPNMGFRRLQTETAVGHAA